MTEPQATPEGLAKVVRIVKRATSHNSGETVWESGPWGTDGYVLRMSSWPRAEEARKALVDAGYACEHMPSDGGHPRIHVGAARRFEVKYTPNDHDRFTPEAIAGLVGQTPLVSERLGDQTHPLAKCEVVAAEGTPDGGVSLTLDVSNVEPDRLHMIREAYSVSVPIGGGPPQVGIGFQVDAAVDLHPEVMRVHEDGSTVPARRFGAIWLYEIGPASPPPLAFPRKDDDA